jgi:hypothetical protein
METGVVDVQNRTFDLGHYTETSASLLLNSSAVTWTYRDEDNDLVKYTKAVADPKVGKLGDYLVPSGCLEVKEPFALQGYYPLYMTQHMASAASSPVGAHSHVINEKTYYMPNAPQAGPIYHGNHDPADTYEELGGFLTFSKQETRTRGCVGKLLTDANDLTKFTSKTFYDRDGNQRTAILVPVSM